jgi:hypothetical protein
VTSPAEWAPGQRIELGPETTPLVFFHFRPTSFEVVPPDGIAEWERLMTEKVGIRPGWDENAELRPVRTVTGCPDDPGRPCDCDEEYG